MSTQTPSNESKSNKTPKGSNDDLLQYFKTHIRETIAYILLVLGIILLFFKPAYGGLLVGIVAGVYFGDNIVNYIKALKADFEKSTSMADLAKNLIILGIAIALLISAPGIFIGAAVSIAIKMLFVG
jgi:hypothetical protein